MSSAATAIENGSGRTSLDSSSGFTATANGTSGGAARPVSDLRGRLSSMLRRSSSRGDQNTTVGGSENGDVEGRSADNQRSQSRGRDFTSTGRGGAGNFVRSPSVSREPREGGTERGRELPPSGNAPAAAVVTHVGRGGAGNVRSPSRDPVSQVREELRAEQEQHSGLIDASKDPNASVAYSTGRGGAGNIRRSPNNSVSPARQRSRSRDPASGRRYQSQGRGGAGNIKPIDGDLGKVDENPDGPAADGDDRGRSGEKHPTGLGGLINKLTGHQNK